MVFLFLFIYSSVHAIYSKSNPSYFCAASVTPAPHGMAPFRMRWDWDCNLRKTVIEEKTFDIWPVCMRWHCPVPQTPNRSSSFCALGRVETAGQPASQRHRPEHISSQSLTLTLNPLCLPSPDTLQVPNTHLKSHAHLRQSIFLSNTDDNPELGLPSLSLAPKCASNSRWYHSSLGTNSSLSLIFSWLLST